MRSWLKKHFPRIDRLVDQYGYWSPPLISLWGLLTWAASSMPSISQYGWGAFVFVGLGVTCATALAVSVSLALYRYFRPIMAPTAASSSQATSVTQETRHADANQTRLELNHLEDFAVNLVVSQLIEDMVELGRDHEIQSPPAPLQLGGAFSERKRAAETFLEEVNRILRTTMRGESIRYIMANAAHEAEQAIRQVPLDERPAGIDPLDLREWAIVHYQAGHVLHYLQRQKTEARQYLRQYRDMFLEFTRARDR